MIILPILLIFLGIGVTLAVLAILVQLFTIGSVLLFISFAILLAILSHKNFFKKYTTGWKSTATKLIKIGIILEMISNVICFLICMYLKITLHI